MIDSVYWPAILVFSGDDELQYIESQHAWMSDPDLTNNFYDSSDRLIDSKGNVFSIEETPAGLILYNQGEHISVAQIDELARRHLSSAGQVCVSKFASTSIIDAFNTVKLST